MLTVPLEPSELSMESEAKPRTLVLGAGGAGWNAISVSKHDRLGVLLEHQHVNGFENDMVRLKEQDLAIFKTTAPHLLTHEVPIIDSLMRRIRGHDLIFIFSGLGGETGSYSAPVLASLARRLAHLVVSVVCTPFTVEGHDRQGVASAALSKLNQLCDATVVLANDGLAKVAPNMQFRKAFSVMDQIMNFVPAEMAQALDLASLPKVRSHFNPCRELRLGVGYGRGVYADDVAVNDAFTSPWFDVDLEQVSSALALFAMPEPDPYLARNMAKEVQRRLPHAKVLYAFRQEPELQGTVQATVLLSRF